MNGRIYDPLLGRFLSADILVQSPGSLQSFNRYSYCANNPLTYTDPSGFELTDEQKKRFEKYQADIGKLGYNVSVGVDKKGNAVFVFTKKPDEAAATKAKTGAEDAQPAATPAKENADHGAPAAVNTQGQVNSQTSPSEQTQTSNPKSGGSALAVSARPGAS